MRTIAKITVTLLLVAAMPLQTLATTFTDVANSNNHYTAIEYLVSIGTLQGYSDNTFKPDQTINRAELMKILVAGQGISPDSNVYNNCFPDVTIDWYAPYVCYAKENLWVNGYADNTFKPAQTVNRAEAVKMIVNAYSLESTGNPSSSYSDVIPSDWYYRYITSLEEKNIIDEASSTYSPADDMTRGLTAEYIFRALVAKSTDEYVYTDAHAAEFMGTDENNMGIVRGTAYIVIVNYNGEVYQTESDEYVEIGNNNDSSIDLEGYVIKGSKGNESYTFPNVKLEPGKTIKVYTNQGDYSFDSKNALWSNDGETVTLYDRGGNIVDTYSY